ncbi:MAG: glucan biosynthesis protein, partial [Rhodopirellula sp. JB055]|uniref:glucan biosynthesis protein n=1 Tax=Rhodopirellula sp. JB055 TaxID=3342846 RepID=UPI00370BA07C
MNFDQRAVRLASLACQAIVIAMSIAATPAKAVDFIDVRDFDSLCELAAERSLAEYVPAPPLPEPLASWQYDDYIKVKFRPERATWFDQGLPFWLETFHRGFVQTDLVELFTLNPSPHGEPIVQRIAFSNDDFVYEAPWQKAEIPAAGHAGFRVVGPFPDRPDAQEMLSFIGSSYFRGRSGDTIYGASARGLALNIAMMQEEEFPDFRAFWIQMPAVDSDQIAILAFMDSPSVTGAYRFHLLPGNEVTRVKVQARIFFRDQPEKIALAPLTSMWMWGDGLNGPPKDSRPSVHDSDGLLIQTGPEEWSWRAFARQSYPSVTSKDVQSLHGFGLIQRNRAFYHYDDHNARYDKRPSVWIQPDSPWPDGRIELLELPGAHEGIDNLAAYWLPPESSLKLSTAPESEPDASTSDTETSTSPDTDQNTATVSKETPGQTSDSPENVSPSLEFAYEVSFFAGDPAKHNVLGRATNQNVTRPDDAGEPIEMEIRFAGP